MDNVIEALFSLKVPIESVKSDPRNARQHPARNLKAIMDSLDAYGQRKPIVVNAQTMTIEAGNGMWEAAQALGWDEIAVAFVKDDKAVAGAYGLMDNQSALLAEWDLPTLKDLLEELDDGETNMELTGFTAEEIENLMTQFYVPKEGLTADDEVPEPKEAICKAGDLWALDNHRLLCGDATVEADVARLMANEKADMVFTDPPYGINVVGSDGKIGGGSVRGKKYYPSQRFNKIIGDEKPFDPNHLFNLAPILCIFGANCFASRLPDSSSWFVWHKGQTANFSECELIWTNIGGRVKYYDFTWNGMTRQGSRKDELMSRIHPTQKPVGLIVQMLSENGYQCIIDPYGGSGSTLIACEKLGRRCFMMEIDEHYCDVIIQRWQNFTGNKTVKL